MPDLQAIVIGGGISGLACARELDRRGLAAVVIERERALGGRCGTMSVEGQPVDFATPFLHARSSEFGDALNELEPAGKLSGWPVRVREPRLASQPATYQPGRRRLARREGVAAFPSHLARGLDVRLNTAAAAIEERDAHLAVRLASGETLEAPYVVVACDLRRSLALATPCVVEWPGALRALAALEAVRPVAVLGLVAAYGPEGAGELPFDLWYPLETTMIHVVSNDSCKRPRPRERVLVIHARPGYSALQMDRADEDWAGELLWEAAELLGSWAARPRWTATHRWEQAWVRASDMLPDPVAFESPRGGRVALVGDAFGLDPGLEGAFMSGVAMGEQIATLCRLPTAHI
jgi:hypothetical protein